MTLKWGDGEYHLFALKVPQIDELQRVTAKAVTEAMAAAGIPTSGMARAILEASGIGAIWNRLLSGNYLRTDITESLRLGLIGGGVPALRAQTLFDTYVKDVPLASREDVALMNAGKLPYEREDAVSNYGVAMAVVNAAIYGLDELKNPKEPGSEGNAAAGVTTADTSMSRRSTGSGEPSNEPPPTSAT